MEIQFDQDYLEELFFKGKTSDKKHRFQPEVIKGYQKAVLMLASAKCIEDLYTYHSLNYEVLVGDKKGISSVRCNKKYRLEFAVHCSDSNVAITICTILDITNHYK